MSGPMTAPTVEQLLADLERPGANRLLIIPELLRAAQTLERPELASVPPAPSAARAVASPIKSPSVRVLNEQLRRPGHVEWELDQVAGYLGDESTIHCLEGLMDRRSDYQRVIMVMAVAKIGGPTGAVSLARIARSSFFQPIRDIALSQVALLIKTGIDPVRNRELEPIIRHISIGPNSDMARQADDILGDLRPDVEMVGFRSGPANLAPGFGGNGYPPFGA